MNTIYEARDLPEDAAVLVTRTASGVKIEVLTPEDQSDVSGIVARVTRLACSTLVRRYVPSREIAIVSGKVADAYQAEVRANDA